MGHQKSLPHPDNERAIQRHVQRLWRGDVGWTVRWIVRRVEASRGNDYPLRVLDASCGFGTYSMLFAKLGAAVTAMDARPEYLGVARWRTAHLIWLTGEACSVGFRRTDLSHGFSEPFDLVWLREGLWRVDPPEYFLQMAGRNLLPGGALVIGDTNRFHDLNVDPPSLELSPYHETFVSSNGRRYGHAYRAGRTPRELKQMLERNGFRIRGEELLRGDPGSLRAAVARRMEPVRGWLRLPGFRARRRFVVATPRQGP
jgi:SAM-dependent methyltransferase